MHVSVSARTEWRGSKRVALALFPLYVNPTSLFLEILNKGLESLTQILDLVVMTKRLSSAPHQTNRKSGGQVYKQQHQWVCAQIGLETLSSIEFIYEIHNGEGEYAL